MHVYDHCPFCQRVELVLARYEIPYERVVYHYGQGAPVKHMGYDPVGGPIKLMGTKILPVLEILTPATATSTFMGESLEIVAYLQSKHDLSLPLVSAPFWLSEWHKRFAPVKSALVRPRVTSLSHLVDWSDPRDVVYAQAKYHRLGFDYEEAERNSRESKDEMNDLLLELAGLFKGVPKDWKLGGGGGEAATAAQGDKAGGEAAKGQGVSPISIMPYGFSGDDICLLPDLRSVTCVKGIVWPEKVRAYVEYHFRKCNKNGVELYDKYAID